MIDWQEILVGFLTDVAGDLFVVLLLWLVRDYILSEIVRVLDYCSSKRKNEILKGKEIRRNLNGK